MEQAKEIAKMEILRDDSERPLKIKSSYNNVKTKINLLSVKELRNAK